MIPESTLREVLDRVDIVELVQEYVELKKSGTSFSGLCPFHSEKTPSFYVHPAKQLFKCFGCQKGGSAFTFYQGVEGVPFPEAVRALAKRVGVEVPTDRPVPRSQARPEPSASHQRLLEANQWAAKYFNYLLRESVDSAYARDYLKQRGITEKTIEAFQIGVAPKGWSTLLSLMAKRGFTLPELVKAGLVVEKPESRTGGYDRFRERLMFPIRDREGNVVGFGGRKLREGDKQPKYINSPESPLFSKRRILYALHENQRGIRLKNEVLIVEGYMDVVGLYEAGVTNAVATMGTALTNEHCQQLRQVTRRVVTIFDADAAGADAWHRSVHLLLEAGLFAKDLTLPSHTDPDEFVLEKGADVFYELCEKAPRQVTKLLKEIAARGPLGEQQVASLLEELTPLLVASRNLPDRALLWDALSLVLGVSRESLTELARSAYQRNPPPKGPAAAPGGKSRPRAGSGPRKPAPLDVEFFQAALAQPEKFWQIPRELWAEGLQDPAAKKWLEVLSALSDKESFEATLAQLVRAEPGGYWSELASGMLVRGWETLPPAQKDPKWLDALVDRLRGMKKEREIQALTAQIRLCQRMGDTQEQLRLLEQLKALRSS